MAIGNVTGLIASGAREGGVAASVHVQLALGLRSLVVMDTDTEMRRRFAYALNAGMARKGWKAPDLAKALGRDASTVTGWAAGGTLPNLLMVRPLADALEVRPEFLFDPPAVPEYPLDQYLLDAADSGAEEGHRRATTRRPAEAPDTPPRRPERSARAGSAGRG